MVIYENVEFNIAVCKEIYGGYMQYNIIMDREVVEMYVCDKTRQVKIILKSMPESRIDMVEAYIDKLREYTEIAKEIENIIRYEEGV